MATPPDRLPLTADIDLPPNRYRWITRVEPTWARNAFIGCALLFVIGIVARDWMGSGAAYAFAGFWGLLMGGFLTLWLKDM